MKTVYTTQELLDLCKKAIVPCENWNNIDSWGTQEMIDKTNQFLSVMLQKNRRLNMNYTYEVKDGFIIIKFDIKEGVTDLGFHNAEILGVDDLDTYSNKVPSLSFIRQNAPMALIYPYNEAVGVIPTQELLDQLQGRDFTPVIKSKRLPIWM